MALSGTINGTCYSYNGSSTNKYEYKIEWSATQNVGANTSTITAQSFVRSTSSSISTKSNNWVSKINGSQVWAGSWTVSGSWVSMGSRSWTVNHNADGTCTTNINGELTNGIAYQDVYVIKRASASANVTLNTIPRASSFTLNKTSGTIGSDTFVVTINKASSSFTHTVYYKFGSNTWTKADKTSATTVNVDIGIGDCNQLPNSTSGTATITVDTYNGNTKVGSASKTITLNVPSNVVPTIGSVTATGNNLLGGIYVAGKSTVTAKINSASGAHGSTIKSYNISGAGISSSASSATSGALGAGDYTITGKVTDSRGRTASKSTKITVHSYYAPSVAIDLYRCDSAGKKSDSGTYARVAITPNIVNVGNANANAKKYQVQWKKASSSSWSTLKDWADLSSYNSTFTCDLGGGWENTTTYNVKINVKDSYSTVSATGTIGTISCILNIEQKGIGIGKPHEQGGLDVAGSVYASSYTGHGNGKNVVVGTGGSDVYVHNSASGKYLQLKDDGTLQYDSKLIYHDGNSKGPTQGNWFSGGFPRVGTNGVMEVGKYIDFHHANNGTEDYSVRLCVDANNKNTVYLPNNDGRLYNTGNHGCKRLANGAWYMTGSQSVGLSDTIWNQAHGIVLVFSAYNPSRGQTHQFDWHTYFVPKSLYTDRESAEGYVLITTFLTNPTLANVGTKHLRVYNNKITGDDRNTQSGSGSGISFKNNEWVLRYVYGV